MEGKIISLLLHEHYTEENIPDELEIYHPVWGFGLFQKLPTGITRAYFPKTTPRDNIIVVAPVKYLFVLLRIIVFKRRYIKDGIKTLIYPVPTRFWETARNKGWLDHSKYIEADIIEGVAIIHGVCRVGCN